MEDVNIANDLLKEEAPKVSFVNHFNTAFIYFDLPNQSIDEISITIYEYNAETLEDLDLNDIKNVETNKFSVSSLSKPVDSPELPLHHTYYIMNNSFYGFKINYVDAGPALEDGTLKRFSKNSITYINNLEPMVYDGFTSNLLVGDIKRRLMRSGRDGITVWFHDYDDAKPGDFVYKGSIFLVTEADPIKWISADPTTTEFILALLYHPNFDYTLWTYYDGDFPEMEDLPLHLIYNERRLRINFKGKVSQWRI